MPGYITHNFFGKEEFKKINESKVKEAIRENRTVFNIGLQGPDIFFYFPGYFLINKKNLGSIMHSGKTSEYISKMLDFALNLDEEDEKQIAIAYLAGFLGHYSLDRICHPYIYWKTDRMNITNDYHAKHVALETDIDFMICEKYYKKKISEFPYGELVRLNKQQLDILAHMLSYSLKNTFKYIRFNYEMAYAALVNFRMIINQIKDKQGSKVRIVSKTENLVIGHEHFSTLFVNDNYIIKNIDPLNMEKIKWYNPWNDKIQSNRNFEELMEDSSEKYQELIKTIEKVIIKESGMEEFREKVGNKSFLTGLEL